MPTELSPGIRDRAASEVLGDAPMPTAADHRLRKIEVPASARGVGDHEREQHAERRLLVHAFLRCMRDGREERRPAMLAASEPLPAARLLPAHCARGAGYLG